MTFFEWINERHMIWGRRDRGEILLTADPIMRKYRFTNVFRQLDRGTFKLREMLKGCPRNMITWTVTWYRMFNRVDHADEWIRRGSIPLSVDELLSEFWDLQFEGKKVYSNAHQVSLGSASCDDMEMALHVAYANKDRLEQACSTERMRDVFECAIILPRVGPFTAYEITCDLRHLVMNPTDVLSWANLGPGSKKGLERLNLPTTMTSMKSLLNEASSKLGIHVLPHLNGKWPPFELQEIEHSLCEYYKYERFRLGGTRPRRLFS